MKVYISPIDIRLGKHEYTIDKLINDIYGDKLSRNLKEQLTYNLGIEKVYKNKDLSDKHSEPQRIVDVYVESARSSLKHAGKEPSDIGQIVTINDNYQQSDPSPSVELVPRLGLNADVHSDNKQGMACSALLQSLRTAYANSILPSSGEGTLVMVGSFYTDWFLTGIDRMKKMYDSKDPNFLQFVYMLMFSDTVASAYVSSQKTDSEYSIEVDFYMSSTRKDTDKDAMSKARARYVMMPFGPVMGVDVDSRRLRESCARLSKDNVSYLKSRFPAEYDSAKVVCLHTAGKNFMDRVSEVCGIKEDKCKLSYDILKNYGNTGAASSLQLMMESVNHLSKGDYGVMVDYGWEGADAFLYRVC
jgi:3-oxoacyl-[acyl-carrier-protein] synthase III